jgi:GT2 family glycosyltransferase/glycosyltransferase involved in cell wall biosynthesis
MRRARDLALSLLTYPLMLCIIVCLGVVRMIGRLRVRRVDALSPAGDITASIVIPNWNGRDLLAECLPSVIESVAATPGEHEIIVVDNASSDDSAALLRRHFPTVRVLEQQANLGFGGGCNAGAAVARGRYLVVLNSDMKVERDFLRTLLEGFEHPATFAVTAQIYFWDPHRRREETGKTRGSLAGGSLAVAHEQPGPSEPGVQPVFYAGGGSTAYDRAKFLALGGFDEIYQPFYVEDTDLSYRAWKRGWPSVLSIGSVVYHKHRGTIGRTFDDDYISNIVRRNQMLFVWKNVGDVRILLTHALARPTFYVSDALEGRLNLRPLRLALARLPRVVRQVWRDQPYERFSDREICRIANDPVAFRDRFSTPVVPQKGQPLNIVFLSPYAPYPPAHGGAVRMYNVIKRLAERHRVTLLTYTDSDEEAARVLEMAHYCHRVVPIVRRPDLSRHNPLGPNPLCRVEFDLPEMRQALQAALAEGADVLQIDYTQMAHFVTASRHILTVLTEHDVSFLSLYRRFQRRPWSWRKIEDWIIFLKMFNYELAMCRRFDLLLTVTEREEGFLRSYLPDRRISSAAPTGVDVTYYQPRPQREARSGTVLFVGYLRHTPNVEAAIYLAREILPRIKKLYPAVQLTIVGGGAPPEVRELARDPSVQVTGYVEDVRDFYRSHAVLAAPILTGAGVRVKVLEAMAAGIPVVTTTIGAEGIRCQEGRDLLIADTPDQFATAVAGLLTDVDAAATMACNARRVVEQHYDWSIIVENLETLYYRHLALKRGSAADNRRLTARGLVVPPVGKAAP